MDAVPREIRWVDTNRTAGRKLVDGGFYFILDKASKYDPGLLFFRCESHNRSSGSCRARVHVRGDSITRDIGDHNHAPIGSRAAVIQAKSAMKLAARTARGHAQPAFIIADATEGIIF